MSASRRFRRAIIALVWCIYALPAVVFAAEGKDLSQVQQEIQRLEGSRQQAENRRTLLMGELRLAEKKIGDVTGQLHGLNDRLERKRDKLRLLRPRFEQQLRAVVREREALARQLRSAFVMGRQHRLKILLNQQDPLLVNRMMGYYGYISKARIERIASLRDKMRELEETEEEIASGERQLLELQKLTERERARLEQARGSRQELVGKLNGDIQGAEQQLAVLREQRQYLTELVDRLAETPAQPPPPPAPARPKIASAPKPSAGTIERVRVAAVPPKNEIQRPSIQRKSESTAFSKVKGQMKWPLGGRLGAMFGSKNEAGLDWEGVLIEAPIGSEVRAIHGGKVAFAEWMRGFGLIMIIDHGDGFMSLYGYNQTMLKKVGDSVAAGEVLALVGDSGGRSASGLYFAIRQRGAPVNPVLWCERPKGRRVG